jgi:hypothetical protein
MNTKECSPAKHHYDDCVERVTGQIDNDGKAKEDCVEECMCQFPAPTESDAINSYLAIKRSLTRFLYYSLPPRSLCIRMRRTQALEGAQVKSFSALAMTF